MSIEVISNADFDEKVVKSNIPVIVDFYADWCGPCKRLSPVLEQIADENKGRLIVYKVNTDASPELAIQHDIKSIPCVISYKNGGIHKRIVGAVPKQALLGLVDL